jgi:putative transposase
LIDLISGVGFPYGYRKLNHCLKEDYGLKINHKKTYRLCKELDILRPQRKRKPYRPAKLAKKEPINRSNQHWQIDLKYGYIHGNKRFFYQISVIDAFDKNIIDSHIGLQAKATDAIRVIKNAAKKRNVSKLDGLIVRSDNGPQFRARAFAEAMEALGITHERIPVNSPNMNAYIESFHSILEDECYSRHEFETFAEAYEIISGYLHYYNHYRRHGSIGYMTPAAFYQKHIDAVDNTVKAA